MRPLFFGVKLRDGQASFEVLFPNDQIDGDHQVAAVRVRAAVETVRQAQEAAAKQFAVMTPDDFAALRKTAELIDREALT